MVFSLFSFQGMESSKSRESFSLSMLTINTNDWSTFSRLMVICLFFLLWNSYICASQGQAGLPRLKFYGSGLASLPSWLGMVNFPNEIYHFSRLSHQTVCIFTWAARSMQSAHYSVTFVCSKMLFFIKCWS